MTSNGSRESIRKRLSRFAAKFAAKFLTRELYHGVFGREALPEELFSGIASIRSTAGIAALVEELLASGEFQRKRFAAEAPGLVIAAYQGILKREPEAEALRKQTAHLILSNNIAGFLDGIAGSLEFRRAGPFAAHRLVVAAYRRILLREPTPEELTTEMERLERDHDIAAWLGELLASPEFAYHKHKEAFDPANRRSFAQKTGKVDYAATPGQLDSIFERIRTQWTELGEREPHWSVLVDENFRSENFSKYEEEFYKSGLSTVSIIKGFFKRAGLEINPAATVLELGCGTGRVTHALANLFAKVIAVDVSPGNMRLCQEKLSRLGKTNVECLVLESPRDIQGVPPVDFFFSTIVLQHNPPPVIHYFLSEILGKIRESGSVLFQVPTHSPGYSFDTAAYLQSPGYSMEMHCLPMKAIFALLAKNGLRPVEVLMDDMTGLLGSHTFFATREPEENRKDSWTEQSEARWPDPSAGLPAG